MGGGTPIIMGGSTDAELQAQLERAALENEKMLSQAATEAAQLQSELDKRDAEMETMLAQQQASIERDLAAQQRALDVELDAQSSVDQEDDLAADYDALQAALAEGLGGSTGNDARPL